MWVEENQDVVDRANLFEEALRLKKDLMLNPGRYEMRSPNPGTVFDPMNMEAETNDGIPVDNPSRNNCRKVRFCLFPAVYLYPSEPELRDGCDEGRLDISNAVVQCRNFSQAGMIHSHFQDSWRVILTEVVVLLEESVAS
jgi:hypothetical protein